MKDIQLLILSQSVWVIRESSEALQHYVAASLLFFMSHRQYKTHIIIILS